MTLSFTINDTLKWLSSLLVLMQESLSLTVSVDVKRHVYLLAVAVFKLLMDDKVPATNSTAVGRLQGGKTM